MTFRRPGEHVLVRQLFRGRLWNVTPGIVARDGPELTAVWLPPGTAKAATGDLLGDWALGDRIWKRRHGILRLTRPGDRYSLLHFWHDDGSFQAWYVNLEQPHRRSAAGFDFEDELLDIWVEPDGKWRRRDEDEVEAAVAAGVYTGERAAEIRREGERVLEAEPWPSGWEDWRPDPGWQPPQQQLPPGWDALESQKL